MRNRIRARGRNEQGAVLIIVAVLMVAFMGFGALAIDLGSYYQAERQVQSAADAGALAAAQDLGSAPGLAAGDATTYAQQNFPGATVAVNTDTVANSVTVKVTATTPTFFGKFLGLTSENVGARAVAGATVTASFCTPPGNGCYAIFAAQQSCSINSVVMGGGVHITGGLHSNGGLDVGGGGSSYGPTTFGTGCPVYDGGPKPGTPPYTQKSITYTSGPDPQAPIASWPLDYAKDFPPCTPGSTCTGACDVSKPCPDANKTPSFCTTAYNGPKTIDTYNPPPTLLSNQIYCDVGTGTASTPSTWNGALTVNGGPVTASFVAGTVTFGGGTRLTACGYTITGFLAANCGAGVPKPVTGNYPVAYALGAGTALDSSSGGDSFTGDMFAPNGTISIGGGNSTTFLEAQIVLAPGGGFTGDGPSDTGTGSGSSSSSTSLLQ